MKNSNLLKIVLVLALCIKSIQTKAQTYKPEYDSKKGKYGFVNDKGVIKNPIYEYAKLINNQYSLVQLYNKTTDKTNYGIVDNTILKPAIPITQENIKASNFHIVVRNGTVNELYDLNLNKIGSYKYVELPLNTEKEDKYTVTLKNEQDKYGVLNYKGELILPFKYDYLRGIFDTDLYTVKENKNDQSVSVIDKSGVFQFDVKGLYMINDYNNNHFIAQLYNSENKIENVLLDKKGNTIIKLPSSAGFLKTSLSDKQKFDNCNLIDLEGTGVYPDVKHSLLNIKGEEVIAADKWRFFILNCNFIQVQKAKGNGEYIYGVYDLEKKKMIIPIQYPKIELRENNTKIMAGTSSVYNIDVEYDLYDLNGNKITSYKK